MEEMDLKQVLTLLLEKEVGFTGKFILEKQCRSLEIDLTHLSYDELEMLAKKVTWAIRSYTGEKRAEEIRKDILDYSKARDVVDNAIARSEEPENVIEAKLTIADNKMTVGLLDEALEALETAKLYLEGMRKSDARLYEVRITRLTAKTLAKSVEKLDDAKVQYEAAIRMGKGTGQHYDIALSWAGLGAISWRFGEHKKALKNYNCALNALAPYEVQSRNDKIKKKAAEALMKSGLGNVYLDLQDYDASIKFNEESIEIFKVLDNGAEIGRVYNNLARVFEEMENYPRAIDRYELAIKHTRESGELRMEGWARTNLASTLIEFGRLDDAREHLDRGDRVLRDFSDPIAHSKLNCMWGKYYRERGEWSNSIEYFQKSIELVENIQSPDYLAISQEEFGIMYLKKGEPEKAKPLLEKALEWYEEKGETTRIENTTSYLKEMNISSE